MVIPLINKSRALQPISKAQQMMGVAAVTAPEITKVQNEVNRMRLRAQGIRA